MNAGGVQMCIRDRDLGLNKIHPEIVKLIGKLKFRASYGQNALAHSLEVAHLAGIIAAECGGDEKLAKRAGTVSYTHLMVH